MKRLSSLRTTRAPTPSTPIFCPPLRSFAPLQRRPESFNLKKAARLFGRLRHLHPSRGIEHRLDDVLIAGAAADVAFQLLADRRLVQITAMPVHYVDGGHDHARRAVAALQAMIVAEGRLHRMQLLAFGDAFDGGDIGAVGLPDQHGAGFHRAAVDMHHTGAALAGVAADMGAGQAEMVAQQMDEERPVLDVGRNRFAVHGQFDCRHADTSRYFLIVPIRGTASRLCNTDFRRGRCDAQSINGSSPRRRGPIPSVFVMRKVSTPRGGNGACNQPRWLWVPAFAGTTAVGYAHHDCRFEALLAPDLMLYFAATSRALWDSGMTGSFSGVIDKQ